MKSQTQMRKLVFHFISIQHFCSVSVSASFFIFIFFLCFLANMGGLLGLSSLSSLDCCDLEVSVTYEIEISEFLIFLFLSLRLFVVRWSLIESNDR